jgi:hypothetical protein
LNRLIHNFTIFPRRTFGSLVDQHLFENEHYSEYAKNTIAGYEDLQTLASHLAGEI